MVTLLTINALSITLSKRIVIRWNHSPYIRRREGERERGRERGREREREIDREREREKEREMFESDCLA